MKKIRNNSKKGFTLVELIVVLVILAVMAAMLVPALTGYIDEARKKKDYNAASEVLTAAQAVVAEYYGATDADDLSPADAASYVNSHSTRISQLAGVNATVSGTSCDTNYQITAITVQLDGGNSYTWNGTTHQWS